jgi:hypothetical protein
MGLAVPVNPKTLIGTGMVVRSVSRLVVNVDSRGDLMLEPGDKPTTLPKLQEELLSAAAKTPNLSLSLWVEKDAPFEKVVQVLDAAKKAGVKVVAERQFPLQVNLKARFVEVAGDIAATLWAALPASDSVSGDQARVLSEEQARDVVGTIESSAGTAILSRPTATTFSDRQVQMLVGQSIPIVTGIDPKALAPPGVPKAGGTSYLTTNMLMGPVIDLFPKVAADNTHIQLTATADLTEFLGYDKPTNSTPVYIGGKRRSATMPLPKFKHRRMETQALLADGQTLLLGRPVDENGEQAEPSDTKKRLLVFVTVTLLDIGGNAIDRSPNGR